MQVDGDGKWNKKTENSEVIYQEHLELMYLPVIEKLSTCPEQ